MIKTLQVYKVREWAKLPKKAYETDAGFDLYYCPENGDGKSIEIWPGNSLIIPTGLKFIIEPHFAVEIKNKSGIAAKKQLLVGACLIDQNYQAEIFVNLHNIGSYVHIIAPGQKIAQMILIKVEQCAIVETTKDPSLQESERGEGALGSTGDY